MMVALIQPIWLRGIQRIDDGFSDETSLVSWYSKKAITAAVIKTMCLHGT